MTESVIHGFKPERVFTFFERLSSIPRGSGNECAVADELARFAKERGLSCYRDGNNNVLIKAPATPGRENDRPLLFQGHTDMVCEKNGDTVHDFLRDPLKLRLEGNRLSADGTTLGGDDGIAVAIMQALLDGELESHPAYECLFTTEEETGMGGAMAFDYGKLSARHMINLDSEEENQITVGCAGGIRSDLCLPVAREAFDAPLCRVSLTGLCGGHSGENINEGRANANLLLARLLSALAEQETFRLVTFDGGSKDNAIPREAQAVLAISEPGRASMRLLSLFDSIGAELVPEDADASLRFEKLAVKDCVDLPAPMDAPSTARVLGVMTVAPCGVLAMSHEVAGLVEYSRNLGVVRTAGDEVKLTFSSRSSKETQLDAAVQSLTALAMLAGGRADHHSRYPGWAYAAESDVRAAYIRAFEARFHRPLRVDVIHAGLECGYIKSKIPDMDIISVGPDMQGIHSPDEVLFLDSVERVWQTLADLIAAWH